MSEKGEGALPLMARSWWWDAVSSPAGKEWIRLTACDYSGHVMASMPCQITRRGPFSAILLPQLTQTSHIEFAPEAGRSEALKTLIRELRSLMRNKRAVIAQVADYMTESDVATLSSMGFEIERRVSYRIAPTTVDEIVSHFHSDKRRTLRKARGLSLDTAMTPDEMYTELMTAYGTVSYSRNLFTSLATAAIENSSGVILRAKDTQNQTAAALLLTHDETAAYYLAYAINPAHRTDGSMEWLTVQAMEYAFSRGLTFDFEGSMIPNIARTYRHYGGQPAHYVFATLYANPLAKLAIKSLRKISKS